MAGRPTVLTDDVRLAIIAAVRAGNWRITASRAAGVSKNVIGLWEKRGEGGEEPYASFMAELQQAEAESEIDLVRQVSAAAAAIVGVSGPDLWQARMTLLERRFPHRWSARVRATVNDELAALMRRLEEKLDGDTFAKVIDASREDASGAGSDQRH